MVDWCQLQKNFLEPSLCFSSVLMKYCWTNTELCELRTSIDKMKENSLKLTKERSRRYPAQIFMDADYVDGIEILANTPGQAETLLHSLEPGIGLHVNAHQTEYMYFNQTGDISTLNGSSLKLVEKFTYHGSSDSSTENDINTGLAKVWTAIDRLSVVWMSDLTDKKKCTFFPAAVVSILLYRCTIWTLTKLHKNAANNNEQVLEVAPLKAAAVCPLTNHYKN